MDNQIKIFENFLSIDECDYIVSKYKKELELSNAEVVTGISKSRKSKVGWIDNLNDINIRLSDVLKSSYNINGMEVTGLGRFQFTEYKVGDYYEWHTDRSKKYIDRFVSTVIQLNDEYSGGILEIKDSNDNLISIEQKKGNLYIFDSELKHRVTTVDDGERYSLVNWVSLIKTDSTNQNIL
jgi:Rps23 Pro-64 3,4-dihydroxylase Tpa1-like proline 4-hydroxylase